MPTEVEESIANLRELHRIGRNLRDPRKAAQRGQLEGQAARLGVKKKYLLRRVERFADSESEFGYTDGELQELFRLMREHGCPLPPSFLVKLLTVRKAKGKRERFRRQMLKEGWSFRDLEREVKLLRNNQKPWAGRRPHVARSPAGLLSQLDAMSTRWLRWHARLEKREEASSLLSGPVSRALDEVIRAVNSLRRTVEASGEGTRQKQG